MEEVKGTVTPTSDTTDTDEGFDRSLNNIHEHPSVKMFHDAIHPHMELPHLCYEIINTPQFQRLRNLKQLGLCSFVYPSASHTRFEHSIGTSYLAGKYIRILQKNQPELQIDDSDILCLEIAGLCHDIGHGPFSHLWERFIDRFSTEAEKKYCHEEMSIRMFEFLLEDNNLFTSFRTSGLLERDLIFIKEAINGKPLYGQKCFQGRDACKYFMYQIVSNEETKVDVDKFDYLLRDSQLLNIRTSFDYERVMDNSRVIEVDADESRWKIVYRQKVVDNLEDLFRGRFRLHQSAYQHKVIKIIEEMLLDALVCADPHFRVYSKTGAEYKLSTAHKDPYTFMTLTDSIFESILYTTKVRLELQAAISILKRIHRRDLYKYLGYFTALPQPKDWDSFLERYPRVFFIRSDINYGSTHHHPLNAALFYDKKRPHQTFSIKFSSSPQKSIFHIICRTGSAAETESSVVEINALRIGLQECASQANLTLYFE